MFWHYQNLGFPFQVNSLSSELGQSKIILQQITLSARPFWK